MVYTSGKKLFPWTKHTSYATVVGERRPSEVGLGVLVTFKQVDKDLDEHRNTLSKMEKKSLYQLDSQRKRVEKSMLEYSHKVRDILDTRTNDLFREIHTRQSHRHHRMSVGSLTSSVDSQDTGVSLPVDSANIRKRKRRLQISKRCMFPPISECISGKGSRQSKLRPASADRDTPKKRHRRLRHTIKPESVVSEPVKINSDIDINHLYISEANIINNHLKQIPEICVDFGKCNVTDISTLDSGYRSTSDLSEANTNTERSHDASGENVTDEFLLTLPKIHKRKS